MSARALCVVGIVAAFLLFMFYRPNAGSYDLYGAKPGQPLPNLSPRQQEIFNSGLVLFKKDFTPEEGLGPLFNGKSCFECHGKPTDVGLEGRDLTSTGVVRIGKISPTSAMAKDVKLAREKIDMYSFLGLLDKGGPAMQRRSITQEFPDKYPPALNIELGVVPPDAQFISLRHAPPTLGLGLIDAISEQTILANLLRQAKTAPDLVGRANSLTDPLTRTTKIGRFGWKDQQPDLLLFTAEAMNAEMGLTTFIQNGPKSPTGIVSFPKEIVKYLPPEPNDLGETLVGLAAFQALLAPPAAPVLNAETRHGKEVFSKLRCAVCHTPELPSAPIVEIPDPDSPFPRLQYIEVRSMENQPVRLYSDLLLHQMGPKLADGIVQGTARGGEWRTTPLWGISHKKFFLHNGSAKTIEAAILAHGGQAQPVTNQFTALPPADKRALLDFVKSL